MAAANSFMSFSTSRYMVSLEFTHPMRSCNHTTMFLSQRASTASDLPLVYCTMPSPDRDFLTAPTYRSIIAATTNTYLPGPASPAVSFNFSTPAAPGIFLLNISCAIYLGQTHGVYSVLFKRITIIRFSPFTLRNRPTCKNQKNKR